MVPITENTELRKDLIDWVKNNPQDFPEIFKKIQELELRALIVYNALPNKYQYSPYMDRVNCNIFWHPKENILAFSFLLFAYTVEFSLQGEGMRIKNIDGYKLKDVEKLVNDAMEHYLDHEKGGFKKDIPKHDALQSVRLKPGAIVLV